MGHLRFKEWLVSDLTTLAGPALGQTPAMDQMDFIRKGAFQTGTALIPPITGSLLKRAAKPIRAGSTARLMGRPTV